MLDAPATQSAETTRPKSQMNAADDIPWEGDETQNTTEQHEQKPQRPHCLLCAGVGQQRGAYTPEWIKVT